MAPARSSLRLWPLLALALAAEPAQPSAHRWPPGLPGQAHTPVKKPDASATGPGLAVLRSCGSCASRRPLPPWDPAGRPDPQGTGATTCTTTR